MHFLDRHKDIDNNVVLKMNRFYLESLFNAIAENSIKFADKAPIEINISVKSSDNKIKLIIKDDGPGIPPEEHKKIFDKFYQVEKDFTGNVLGMGLGLSLAKLITEGHNGTIELKSYLGKGTEII